MIIFIDPFFLQSLNYRQYSDMIDLHNLQFTITRTRILVLH
jgi:hypothetical protein